MREGQTWAWGILFNTGVTFLYPGWALGSLQPPPMATSLERRERGWEGNLGAASQPCCWGREGQADLVSLGCELGVPPQVSGEPPKARHWL